MDDARDPALRRERLIARCAAQRETLASALRELDKPIAVADRIASVACFLRAHPVVVVTVVAALVAVRPHTLLALAARGLAAWRLWRAVAALVEGPAARWLRGRAGGRS
ncbi:MAG: hypothetical protein IT529_20565 [Burkholderiales bacterium]|nr:hypothetical protein [Burkholderiales bacterium]